MVIKILKYLAELTAIPIKSYRTENEQLEHFSKSSEQRKYGIELPQSMENRKLRPSF
jgi:hypothetical protein